MTLGVYLLGALDPAERSRFESHLSRCDTCRGELVRLSPLPGLLNQITPADFEDGLPPADTAAAPVLTQPVTQPVTEPVPVLAPLPQEGHRPAPVPQARRYWRVAAAAAAVVVLAIGGVFAWGAIREEQAPPAAQGVTWSAGTGAAGVEARLVDHEWGTEIQSRVHGAPPGRGCYLKVYDHYGKFEIAGWWGTDHDESVEIPASTSFPRSRIAKLEYLLDDKETVVAVIQAPGR
jgi:anti-sigma factor RsiW